MLAGFIDWTNMKAIALPVMVVIPQIHRDGGEVLILLHSWIIRLYITVRFPPMMPTGVLSKCTGTNVPYRQIQRS